MLIPFGQWAPDAIATAKDVSHAIRNVLPDDALGTYRPAPAHAPETTLPGVLRGGFLARAGRDAVPFVGTADGLYVLAATVTDVSKTGGYALTQGERWRFAQHKNTVIAASIDAPVQAITVGGTQFADLIVGTRKPKARVAAIVAREWLVLGNTTDSQDGAKINRVWWSRVGDPTNFDPDNQYFSGLQDLDASGAGVMAIVGVEYATVIMRHDTWRMTPDTSVENGFRFDKLDPGHGAIAEGAVASQGRHVFYLDEGGPRVFDGTQSAPIGVGQWAGHVMAALNKGALDAACTVVDPHHHLVWWFLPTGAASLPNKAIVYNTVSGRAAPIEVEIDFACAGETPATYVDSPAIADLSVDTSVYADVPVDSRLFEGGVGVLCAADRQHRWGAFAGAPLPATLETGEIAVGGRANCDAVTPLVSDCANPPRVSVLWRNSLATPGTTATPPRRPDMDGAVHPFAQAALMRFRVEIDGAFHRALGVDAAFTPAGLI